MITLVPGGENGVALKSKLPWRYELADSLVFAPESRKQFIVRMPLWDEMIPFGSREFGISTCQTRFKIVFPSSDGIFRSISVVDVWKD